MMRWRTISGIFASAVLAVQLRDWLPVRSENAEVATISVKTRQQMKRMVQCNSYFNRNPKDEGGRFQNLILLPSDDN